VEELPYLKDIEKLIGKTIPQVEDHPYPMLSTTQPVKVETSAKPAALKPAKPKAKNPVLRPKSEWFKKGSKTSR
jgi:ATP-dependent RNA helicase RhlE